MDADLPFVDRHSIDIDSSAGRVWPALLETLDASLSRPAAAAFARAIGCAPRASSGPRPLAEGSTVPGFRVVAAQPERELVLEGRHRFSSYRLAFRLDGDELTAESYASFPGLLGSAYRGLVIGTGFHVVGVRGLLASVKQRVDAGR